ncbi:hypothetical protein GCM10027614_68810 [Micromonospora vulcania]
MLLFVLVTLVAAGPLPRRAVQTLPAQVGSEALVAGDLFLVIDPITTQTGQRRLAAFRLPGGEPAWQTPLPADGQSWWVTPLDGTLLATGHRSNPDGESTVTVALDRATGAYRWQQPGSPVLLADGNLLLQSTDAGGSGTMRAVDPCCGTVRWQLSTPPADVTYRAVDGLVDRVVFSSANGPTEVRDALTGTVLARTDLRTPGGGAYASVQVVDDLLLTVGGVPATVTAYGLDRLDRRWSTIAEGSLYSTECTPVICLQTRSGGVRAIDLDAGRELWSSERWGWVWPYADRLLATTLSSAGPGAEELVVLDPPTGRVLAELGRWELASFRVDGTVVGLRRHPNGGLLIAELDVHAGTARLLDVLPDATGECQSSPGRLLCRRFDGSYGLWQLPD